MGNHVSAYQAEVIDLVSDAEDERENEDVEVFDVEDSDGDVAFLDEMPREHRAPGPNDNSMAIDRPSINDNQTVAYSPNFDVSEDSQIHNHIYENRFGGAAASTTADDGDYHYQVPSMLQQENIPTSPSSSLPSFYERMIQQGSSDLTVEERALIENCIRLIKAKDRLEHYNNQQQQLLMMQTPEEHASPGGGDGGNNLEVHNIAGPSISSSANVAMNVSSSSDVTEYPASTTSSSTPSTEIASNSSIRQPLPGNGRGRGRPFGSAQSKYYRRRLQQDPEGTRRRAREARERFFNSMTPEQRRSYVKGLYRKKVTTEITSD